jgi:hypothetical protein
MPLYLGERVRQRDSARGGVRAHRQGRVAGGGLVRQALYHGVYQGEAVQVDSIKTRVESTCGSIA